MADEDVAASDPEGSEEPEEEEEDHEDSDDPPHEGLHAACLDGRTDVVRRLIADRADVGRSAPGGVTPLHGAAEHGHADIVRALLDAGADPGAVLDYVGMTPLHLATLHGHVGIAKMLSCHPVTKPSPGTEPLAPKSTAPGAQQMGGTSPLHMAAMFGREGFAREILDAGGGVAAVDCEGNTPLFYACRHGQEGVMRMLVDAGADVGVRNYGGKSPADFAVGAYQPQVQPLKELLLVLLKSSRCVRAWLCYAGLGVRICLGAAKHLPRSSVADTLPPLPPAFPRVFGTGVPRS